MQVLTDVGIHGVRCVCSDLCRCPPPAGVFIGAGFAISSPVVRSFANDRKSASRSNPEVAGKCLARVLDYSPDFSIPVSILPLHSSCPGFLTSPIETRLIFEMTSSCRRQMDEPRTAATMMEYDSCETVGGHYTTDMDDDSVLVPLVPTPPRAAAARPKSPKTPQAQIVKNNFRATYRVSGRKQSQRAYRPAFVSPELLRDGKHGESSRPTLSPKTNDLIPRARHL